MKMKNVRIVNINVNLIVSTVIYNNVCNVQMDFKLIYINANLFVEMEF